MSLQRGIEAELRRVGLIVHNENYGTSVWESLGWEFNREMGTIRPKRGRVWKPLASSIMYSV